MPRNGTRLIAMGREAESDIEKYLQSNGVIVDQVLESTGGVRLFSTPSLVLVERGLRISGVWIGQLSDSAQENSVIDKAFNSNQDLTRRPALK